MSGRYRSREADLLSHIGTLRLTAGLLAVSLLLALWGWHAATRSVRFHVPPDLRYGGIFRSDRVPAPSVYTFAGYIWQQANRWRENGARDYPAQLATLKPFLTPRFYTFLQADAQRKHKRGELAWRTREISPLHPTAFDDAWVVHPSQDQWVVQLDVRLKEHMNGASVKDIAVQYRIRVVTYDVDPELNPWGLALDGFDTPPRRLALEEKQ